MSKFFVDTQLPPILAHHLVRKGCDAIHTTFFPEGHLLQDKDIISIAINEERVIITKDNDFFDNYFLNGAPPKILLLQCGNIRNQDLLRLFDNYFEMIMEAFEQNCSLVIFDKEKVIGF